MKRFSLAELKNIAKSIFKKGVEAVDPIKRLKNITWVQGNQLFIKTKEGFEKNFDLTNFRRIYLIGSGKASSSMAKVMEEILGERINRGIIVTKYGHSIPLQKSEIIEAGHPIPDSNGLEASKKIKKLLSESGESDMVIFLLSGGASSLLPMPSDGITLEEKQEVTQLLLDCGADIKEINTVRKHISMIKGGWFSKWAYPSIVITFILSDVVGDPLDIIGSGPTVPDPSSFEHAWKILEKYDLINEISSSIRNYLILGREGKVEETPKPKDPIFERVFNVLIGSNLIALQASKNEALSFSLNTLILSSFIEGDTRDVAQLHGAIAKEIIYSDNPIPRPACILSGGETTVNVKGRGLGGRNQEFALTMAFEIDGLEEVVFLSGGTDGTDGPTDAAGAIADHTTISRAREIGLDPKSFLLNNDSYNFFKRLGDLLVTGPTHTNVMDLRILLVD